MSFDIQIASIESDMRQLRIEFDRFLAGATRLPPDELRFRLKTRIRRMRQGHQCTSAQRFRLSTLEASFNTLNELQLRRLREAESGKAGRPKKDTMGPTLDAARGFELGEDPPRAPIEALYQKLYGSDGRDNRVDFDSFEEHVAKQVARLRKKTGCEKVHLRVAREGETLKLKAKPVRKEK